jgi:hypothetical protein
VATWQQLADAEPEMAALGLKLLGIAYLATTRSDGSPRVHPVCPVIAGGRLFVATAPDSPKRLDLLRDSRYAMHFLPGDNDAEFYLTGRARRIEDPAVRSMVVEAARKLTQHGEHGLQIRDREWLFEYDIAYAMTARWEHLGTPEVRVVRREWRP